MGYGRAFKQAIAPRAYLLAWFALVSTTSAATITVDPTGQAGFLDIQAAIDAAEDGDTILVKPGEYAIAEPIDFRGAAQLLLRSEGGAAVTAIRMVEAPRDPERASVMVFQSGEAAGSVMSGFTLTGGSRLGGFRRAGGGILVLKSSPRIEKCTITGNTAGNGGGIYCGEGASPAFVDCTIVNNTATCGGGICLNSASPAFVGCTIAGNTATWGGGASCFGGMSTFNACTIAGNAASAEGAGGIYLSDADPALDGCAIRENAGCGLVSTASSCPTLVRCTIERNSGSDLLCDDSAPELKECSIAGNRTLAFGGGVFCQNGATPFLDRCAVIGNMAEIGGGLCVVDPVFMPKGGPILVNTTIAGNKAATGGGSYASASSPIMVNCTVAGNRAREDGGVAGDVPWTELVNCIVWGNVPGSAFASQSFCILDEDPLFLNPGRFDSDRFTAVEIAGSTYELPDFIVEEPDFRLQAASVAIDAGTSLDVPAVDADGNGRPCGAGVDIGAYEYGGCSGARFIRGDATGDGTINVGDAVSILKYIFQDDGDRPCPDAVDFNDDGRINVADAVLVLTHLFADAPPGLPETAGKCAVDATPDDLPACDYDLCKEDPHPFFPDRRVSLLVFVLDRSSSMGNLGMNGMKKLDLLRQEAIKIVEGLSSRYFVSVVFFDKSIPPLIYGDPPIAMTVSGKANVTKLIQGTSLEAGTCPLEALTAGLAIANRHHGCCAELILISDGRTACPNGERDPDRVFSQTIACNVLNLRINTIYVGLLAGEDWSQGKPLLERLARTTRGIFRIAGDPWVPPWR